MENCFISFSSIKQSMAIFIFSFQDPTSETTGFILKIDLFILAEKGQREKDRENLQQIPRQVWSQTRGLIPGP